MKTRFFQSVLLLLFPLLIILPSTNLVAENQKAQIDSLLLEASEYHQAGLMDYIANNPIVAIKNYEKALNIRKEIYSGFGVHEEKVLEGIIKGYLNIGYSWYNMGNYEKMETYLDSCMMVQLEFEEKFSFFSHYRRGQYFHSMGQLYRSVAGLEQSLSAFRNAYLHFELDEGKSFNQRLLDQGKVLNDISVLFIKWEMEPDSILYYAQSALKTYQDLLNSDYLYKYDIHKEIANAKINKGHGYVLNGDLGTAENSFKEALEELNALKAMVEEDMKTMAKTEREWHVNEFGNLGNAMDAAYNGLGINFLHKRKYSEAEEALAKAISLNNWLKELDPNYQQADILLSGDHHNLAEVYFAKDEYQKSLEENQKAIESIIKDFLAVKDENGNPDITNDSLFIYENIYFLNAISGKAKCLRHLGRTEEALATTDLAIRYIYQIRRNYLDMESRFQLANFMKKLTEGALAIYLGGQEPDIEQAFYYAEKNKIYTLLEAVKDHKTLKVAQVDQVLLATEKSLRLDIERLTNLISGSKSPAKKAELMERLGQKKETLREVLEELHQNPNYQRLFVGLEPVKIADIQDNLLARDQALVEYFVGHDSTFVFLVPKRGKVCSFAVPIGEEALIRQVDELLNGILYSYQKKEKYQQGYSSLWTRDVLERQFLNTAQKLYTDFLAPAMKKTRAKRLVIIPDGPFNKMPFSALVQPDPNTLLKAYRTYNFVAKDYALSYCYAATLLEEMQRPIAKDAEKLLAFAPTFLGGKGNNKAGLTALRFNQAEVAEICRIFSCTMSPYIGAEAVKQKFKELIQEKPYYFLHLSTHGKADYNDPNNSFISFSQMDSGMVDKKQFFLLRELYNLEIAVETVVLSSCETNLGPIHRAGGMLSLTRGFAFAGANSIVSSLWEVNEESTKELMVLFYQNLKNGMNKDHALQAAKMELRKNSDYMHPYYWAAFIPVGKTQVRKPLISSFGWFAFGMVLIIGLVFGIKKRLTYS